MIDNTSNAGGYMDQDIKDNAQDSEPVAIWHPDDDVIKTLARRNLFLDIDTQHQGGVRGVVPPQPPVEPSPDARPTEIRAAVIALVQQADGLLKTQAMLAEHRTTDLTLTYAFSVLRFAIKHLREIYLANQRAALEGAARPPAEPIDTLQAAKSLNRSKVRLLDYLRHAPELRAATAAVTRGMSIEGLTGRPVSSIDGVTRGAL